jgi:hypothetical protein
LSEEVIGLIGPLEGKGKGKVTRRFALVFTKNELIVVKIGGTLSIFTGILSEAVESGYGLSTIGDVYSHITNKRVEKFKDMKVQDILNLDKLNFSIPYSNLDRVEVKKKSVLSPKGRWIVDIATSGNKYWFRFAEKKSFEACAKLVKKILPNKA